MTTFFFLGRLQLFFSISLILVGVFFFPLGVYLLLSISTIFYLYMHLRLPVPYQETFKLKHELILSPVTGQVVSIRQGVRAYDDRELGYEIRISIPFWCRKGLYLPTTGEVTYLKANQGLKIPLDAEDHKFYGPLEQISHTDFLLTSTRGMSALLRFVDAPFGKRPSLWLKFGDRGRAAACFGYYSLGGTLLIYLPENSDILVYKNEWVTPGKTVIASIKGK